MWRCTLFSFPVLKVYSRQLGGVIETLYIEEDKLQLPLSIRGKKADKQRRSPLAGREALRGPSSVGSAGLYVKSCEVRTPVQVSPSSGQDATSNRWTLNFWPPSRLPGGS